ncbi:MAG: hypothetical protein NZM25_06480 [Leptospiraceae bacterium]|nr:hypothetical protein [Leptospiraceae bacterium]MDW8306578.1 hypothetical protein [Leptospiraceae bacterium]
MWLWQCPPINEIFLTTVLAIFFSRLFRKKKTQPPLTTSKSQETPKLIKIKWELKPPQSPVADDLSSLHDASITLALQKYVPYFYSENEKMVRLYPLREKNTQIEKILLYWQGGYREAKLALFLVFYYEATRGEDIRPFLYKTLTYQKIPSGQRKLLQYLYQDLFERKAPPPGEEELAISKRLLFCFRYLEGDAKINRSLYRRIVVEDLIPIEPEFQEKILKKATLMLFYQLVKEEKLKQQAELLFKQFLKSGKVHEPQLWLEGQISPHVKLPKDEEELHHLLAELVRHSPLAKLLAFCLVEKQKPLREKIYAEAEDLENWKKWLSAMPPRLRRAAFILASESHFHREANEFFPRDKVTPKELKLLLLKARNFYFSGAYKEALEMMEELLPHYSQNFYVLHDAAIYKFKLGKIQEAEELFFQLKELYPHHPAVLHNEALFFEQKALQQIQQRWENYEKSRVPA